MTKIEYITYIVCNYVDEKLISDKLIATTIFLVTIASEFCPKEYS